MSDVAVSEKHKQKLSDQKLARQHAADKRRTEGRVHNHDGARCKRCHLPKGECQDKTKECSACGTNVAVCAEEHHQGQMYCIAATTARPVAARGLVRAPSDAIVVMMQSAGVPVEWHMTGVSRVTPNGPLGIRQEAWIQPEAIEIVRVDRPLAERMKALARLSELVRSRQA